MARQSRVIYWLYWYAVSMYTMFILLVFTVKVSSGCAAFYLSILSDLYLHVPGDRSPVAPAASYIYRSTLANFGLWYFFFSFLMMTDTLQSPLTGVGAN